MKKLVPLAFLILLFICPQFVLGQRLGIKERLELVYSGEALVLRLENLLNNLASTSTTDNRADFLIQESYREGRNQLFYNKDIVIEDDLDPQLSKEGEGTDVFLEKYLNDFRLFILKSSGPSVEFSEVEAITNLEEGAYKFVRVSFYSQILNNHMGFSEAFPKVRRIAEIRVEYIEGTWVPLIHGITYYRETPPVIDLVEDPSPEPNPVIEEPLTEDPDKQEEVQDTKDITPPAEPDGTEIQPVDEISPVEEKEEEPVENPNAYRFASPTSSDVVKFGENLGISWSNLSGLPGDVELRLVGKDKAPITLIPSTNSASFNWTPEKGDMKGGLYRLEVINKENPLVYGQSPEFRLKSKFPLLIVGGAVLGGALVALCVLDVICPEPPPPPETLPDAPDPVPIN